MPKRTNEFQKLIKLLESQLASENVKIEESKLLRDKRSGEPREIDILIQTEINGHSISIAVECTDRTRKAGTPWIEQLKGKYDALPVDKVIAVSKSGFSKPAKKVAKDCKIKLLTLEEAINEDWLKSVKHPWEIKLTTVYFKSINVNYGLSQNLFEKDRDNISVFNKEGENLGTLGEFSKKLLYVPPIRKQLSEELISNYDIELKNFPKGEEIAKVTWSPNNRYILKDEYKFECNLKEVEYSFVCLVQETSISTDRFTYNKAQVATTTKEIMGMDLMFSLVEKEDRNPTIAISAELEGPDDDKYTYELITNPLPVSDLSVELGVFVIG